MDQKRNLLRRLAARKTTPTQISQRPDNPMKIHACFRIVAPGAAKPDRHVAAQTAVRSHFPDFSTVPWRQSH
jgi:hypothetical protein